MQPNFITSDIFTVTNILSALECQKLIERAESLGFEPASVRTNNGPKMMTNIRNNDRVNIIDAELAEFLWTRVARFIPSFDGKRPIGADQNLRFYRYEPGQEFKRHKDGAVTDPDGNVSKLSYLIYLNSEFEGGSTTFRDYIGNGESRKKIEHVISPGIGCALLFRHELWHEGTALTSGRKYVLRTDIFFES